MMIDVCLRDDLFQSRQQPGISLCGRFLLPCLVIFTAVHDVIEAAMSIDPQVIVRLSRIPEKRFRYRARGDSSAERVAGIERKFCL